MVKIVLDSYVYTKSYLILKFKNVVKFYVHIRPIFSCRVTYTGAYTAPNDALCYKGLPITQGYHQCITHSLVHKLYLLQVHDQLVTKLFHRGNKIYYVCTIAMPSSNVLTVASGISSHSNVIAIN